MPVLEALPGAKKARKRITTMTDPIRDIGATAPSRTRLANENPFQLAGVGSQRSLPMGTTIRGSQLDAGRQRMRAGNVGG